MSETLGGAMAAVIGVTRTELEKMLKEHYLEIEIANYNSYLQNVVSGPVEMIAECEKFFGNRKIMFVKLNVSGAFHSSYMKQAKKDFDIALEKVDFKAPNITVLSNYKALPYDLDNEKENLSMQLISPVKWLDIIGLLLKDADEIMQIGSGKVLDGLTKRIKKGQ